MGVRVYPANLVSIEAAWQQSPAHLRAHLSAGGEGIDGAEGRVVERRRPPIYEGTIDREQAARGAVIAQYVSIAQSLYAATAASGSTAQPGRGRDASFIRRDLIGAMLQYMTGGAGAAATGTVISAVA